MGAQSFRFEPLDAAAYPPGTGPFRARGFAYNAALEYVDKRFPGGRPALRAAFGAGDPYVSYLDQLFLASGDYDVSPLVRLYVVLAAQVKTSPATFVEVGSRRSAVQQTQGMWKPMLKTSSPEAMAERVHYAFNRYFEPTQARNVSVSAQGFEVEFTKVPIQMRGIYLSSTNGFVTAALELAGATTPELVWQPPVADGELKGVRIEKVRFLASFR
jgi:hypothetical protein